MTLAFRGLFFVAISALFPFVAAADQCSDVLVGIHNKEFVRSTSEAVDSLIRIIEKSEASSYSEASAATASLGLFMPAVPAELSSAISANNSRSGNWSSKFREYLNSNSEFRKSFERSFEYTNASVVEAWKSCMSGKNGIQISAESDEDGLILLNLKWSPPLLSIPEPKIKSLDFEEDVLDLISPKENKGLTIPYAESLPLTFRRKANDTKATYLAIFTDNEQFQTRIRIAGAAPKFPPPPPSIARAQDDFNGDRVADSIYYAGNTIVTRMSPNGAEVRTTPSSDYNTGIGKWVTGDFDGDGCTDLVHIINTPPENISQTYLMPDAAGLWSTPITIVKTQVIKNQYAHVHISNCSGGFYPPSRFRFDQLSNSPDYDASMGTWDKDDCRTIEPEATRRSVLVHYARTDATHYWIPDSSGREMRINRDCNG